MAMFEGESTDIVKCTACRAVIDHRNTKTVFSHDVLDVLICKKCYDFYQTGQWSRDEDGQDEYCRWCGEGGRLYICYDENCLKGFCRSCIKHNLGKDEIGLVEATDEWRCYICDPKPIEKIQHWTERVLNQVSAAGGKSQDRTLLVESNSQLLSVFEKLQKQLRGPKGVSVEIIRQDTLEAILNLKIKVCELEKLVNSEHFAKFLDLKPPITEKKLSSCEEWNPSKENSESDSDVMEIDIETRSKTSRTARSSEQVPHITSATPDHRPSTSSSEEEDSEEEKPNRSAKKNNEKPGIIRKSALEASKTHCERSNESCNDYGKCGLEEIGSSEEETTLPRIPGESTPEQSVHGGGDSGDDRRSGELLEDEVVEISGNKDSDQEERPKGIIPIAGNSLNWNPIVRLARIDGDVISRNGERRRSESDDEETLDRLMRNPVRRNHFGGSGEGSQRQSEGSIPIEKTRKKSGAVSDSENLEIFGSSSDEECRKPTPNEKVFSDSSDCEIISKSAMNSASDSDPPTKAKPKKTRREFEILSSEEDEASGNQKKGTKRTISAFPSEEGGSDVKAESDREGDDPGVSKEKVKKNIDTKKKPNRKNRKRARIIDSDEEADLSPLVSDSGSEIEKEIRPKKRRKKGKDDSGDDEDDEVQEKNSRAPRKIISDDRIKKESRMAAKDEGERRKRVLERQKLYNEIEESMKDGQKDSNVTRCVLEYDAKTKEPLVEVDRALATNMKPHQVEGVKFLYNTVIESVEQLGKENEGGKAPGGGGAVLAHCMGLGKTLQTICFIHTLLTNIHTKKHIKKVIIVCPCNVVLNWSREFDMWLEENEKVLGRLNVFEFSRAKSIQDRIYMLEEWFKEGGILIIGYSMFRVMTQVKTKSKKIKDRVPKLLHDPGADLVVCDEGHMLKSDKAQISKAMNLIRTRRRIILTGTPLQNNMSEYHCMVSFVKPNLLGTAKEFNNRFMNPITYGQEANASQYCVKVMKKRVHILNKLLGGCVHRCDYSHLTPYLPTKFEYILSIELSDLQKALYRKYLEYIGITEDTTREDLKGRSLLKDYQTLKMIWSHPFLLMESADRQEDRRIREAIKNELEDFVVDESDEEADSGSNKSATSGDSGEDEGGEDGPKRKYRTRGNRKDNPLSENEEEVEDKNKKYQKSWWYPLVPENEDDFIKLALSSKLTLALEILRDCELIGDKVIIFSTSLLTLSLFERLLQLEYQRFCLNGEKEEGDYLNSWVHGIDYFRLDGGTNVETRKKYIDAFNDCSKLRARLFLVSTKAGGIGTNMVGANRIIVLDASWNPSDDTQAIFRAYRYGQVKPVYVYRLLAHATMEEKIYDRQVNKISLASRVVDEQNLERHFNESDLKALYEFKPEKDARKTPAVPKDRLLAEMLIKHKALVQGYHEHDSLLQKELEDELTEDERKAAWKEYEDERDGKTTPMGNPMGPQTGSFNLPYMAQFAGMNGNNFSSAARNMNPAYQDLLRAQQDRSNTFANMYLHAMREQLAQHFRTPAAAAAATANAAAKRAELLKRPPHFNFQSKHPLLNPQAILEDTKVRYPEAGQLEIANLYRAALVSKRDLFAGALQRVKQSIEGYTKQGMNPPAACLEGLQQCESAVNMLMGLIPKLDEAISGAKSVLKNQAKNKGPVPVVDLDGDDAEVVENPSTSRRRGPKSGPIIEEVE